MANLDTLLHALSGFPSLQGVRVCLRGPRMADASALFDVFSNPQVMRYWTSPPMRDPLQAEGKVVEMLEAFGERKMLHWVIADRADTAIGTCALFAFDGRHATCGIGYALRADLWRRGLAAEAVALATGWAFRSLGLVTLSAQVEAGNVGSVRLLEGAGFQQVDAAIAQEAGTMTWTLSSEARRRRPTYRRRLGDAPQAAVP